MAKTITRQLHPGIVDIVLSCSVCQDTLSSIYASSVNDRGLRQGPDLKGGSINKLWLTECAHIVCGKHLEGGEVCRKESTTAIFRPNTSRFLHLGFLDLATRLFVYASSSNHPPPSTELIMPSFSMYRFCGLLKRCTRGSAHQKKN
ncbi:MAG: hypothetical protein Q9228_000735 [Teloschistes exilis]